MLIDANFLTHFIFLFRNTTKAQMAIGQVTLEIANVTLLPVSYTLGCVHMHTKKSHKVQPGRRFIAICISSLTITDNY